MRSARDRADARLDPVRRPQHLYSGPLPGQSAVPYRRERHAPRRQERQPERQHQHRPRHVSRPPQRLQFLMNSIGGAWDTQITDERDANRDWNTPWVPRSRRDAEGWTVEMAIPFRSLRYRGSGPQVWGINIRRNVRWKNELSYESRAAPVRRPRHSRALAGGDAGGTRGAAVGARLDVKPCAVGSVTADRTIDPAFENEIEPNAGFDVNAGSRSA